MTPNQQKFADLFIKLGNATEAYKQAGYTAKGRTAEVNASRLLRNAEVKDYIEQQNREIKNDRIADMQEVKEFWTQLVRDRTAEHRDRLKASEYIAKTNAAFIERLEHSGETGVRIINDIPRSSK